MASLDSRVTLTNQPAKKTDKRGSTNISVENPPQIKVARRREDSEMADDVSVKTDETNTGSDDVSTETDKAATKTDDAGVTGTDDVNTGMYDAEGTRTDDASTESVYVPEGGWGWMVTVAGFVVAFIVDGIMASFGLLIPNLMETFGADMAITSLPQAILGAVYQVSGPMTAFLVQRWGCRLVGLCGGVIAALGVAASAFAPNIHLFILGFGLVAGVGVGLIYLPSITMVNAYFHKKRGMVAGIITSGSGFGLLALAPLTEILMEEYGWRGCYLIMAAITLNFCVCASLMRPLHPRPPTSSTPTSTPTSTHTPGTRLEGAMVVEGREGNCLLLSNSQESLSLVGVRELKKSGDSHPHLAAALPTTQVCRDGQDNVEFYPAIHLVENGQVPRFHNESHLDDDSEYMQFPQKTHSVGLFSSVKNLFLSHHVISGSHGPVSSDGQTCPKQGPIVRSRSHGHLESSPSPSHKDHHTRLHVNALSTWLACQVPPSLSRHSLRSHQSSDNMAARQQSIGAEQQRGRESCGGKLEVPDSQGRQDGVSFWGHSLPSMNHDDVIFKHVVMKNQIKAAVGIPLLSNKSSIEDIHHKDLTPTSYFLIPNDASSSSLSSSSSSSNEYDDDVTLSPEPGRMTMRREVRRWMGENRVFILFLIGAFLIQLVCNVSILLAPSYAYQHGVSKEQVATILSIYGVLNTAGRLLAGVCVYCGVRSLHVYNLGTLLSAVACFTFPFSTSFPTIALTLGLHGFFLGAFPPLQSVILVEYLGLDRLNSTFGIMCLVKSFASAAGAPLAGMLG
ncbi:hypothetical protein ACOMHN_002866 [Nucella lapillus]